MHYVQLWQDAGDETIAETVAALQTLLAEQPATPASPMPILPPPGAVNDLAVLTQYIDFVDGSGVRFVGRLSQDASPVLNGQTDYYVQGLTEDGRFYISMRWPVTTSDLPTSMEEMTPEQQQAIENDFAIYMQQTTDIAQWTRTVRLDAEPCRSGRGVQFPVRFGAERRVTAR